MRVLALSDCHSASVVDQPPRLLRESYKGHHCQEACDAPVTYGGGLSAALFLSIRAAMLPPNRRGREMQNPLGIENAHLTVCLAGRYHAPLRQPRRESASVKYAGKMSAVQPVAQEVPRQC